MGPERIAPQRFGFKDGRPTKPSDCYALGMVIYETVSGNLPFHKHADLVVLMKVVEGVRPTRGGRFTESLWDVLERCWEPEPNNRPSVEDVLYCLEMATNLPEPPSPGADEGVDGGSDEQDSETGSSDHPLSTASQSPIPKLESTEVVPGSLGQNEDYNEVAPPTSHSKFGYSRPRSSHHGGVSCGSTKPRSSQSVSAGDYVNNDPRPRGLSTLKNYSPLNRNATPATGWGSANPGWGSTNTGWGTPRGSWDAPHSSRGTPHGSRGTTDGGWGSTDGGWGSTDALPAASWPDYIRGSALRHLSVPSNPSGNWHPLSISPTDHSSPSISRGELGFGPVLGQSGWTVAEPWRQSPYAMTAGLNPASSAWTPNTTSSRTASLSSSPHQPSQNDSPFSGGTPGPVDLIYRSPFARGAGRQNPDSRPGIGYSITPLRNYSDTPAHPARDFAHTNGKGNVRPDDTIPGASFLTTTMGLPEMGTPPTTRGGQAGDHTEADVGRRKCFICFISSPFLPFLTIIRVFCLPNALVVSCS